MKIPIYLCALSAMLLSFSFNSSAQHVATSQSFDGYWLGEFFEGEKSAGLKIFEIKNGVCMEHFYNGDVSRFFSGCAVRENTMLMGNNLVYSYVADVDNKVWRSFSYLISYLKDGFLYCISIEQYTHKDDPKNLGMNGKRVKEMSGALKKFGSKEEAFKYRDKYNSNTMDDYWDEYY